MGRKCAVVGCRGGYLKRKRNEGTEDESAAVAVFSFPNNPELKSGWIKFVNRADWVVTENSGICVHHFEEKHLKRGKRITLINDPIPTLNSASNGKPSLLPIITPIRKPPFTRIF